MEINRFRMRQNSLLARSLFGLTIMLVILASSYFMLFPTPVLAVAPTLAMDGWKDGQTKVVIIFDQPVNDGANGSLVAADFTVSGANQISISSVSHTPNTEVVILTLSGSLNSGGGTDFTIACATNAVYNTANQACTTSGINIYTGVSEDTTGPVVEEIVQISGTTIFIAFDDVIDASSAVIGNFTLTTADGGDDSSITSVTNFSQGVEVTASAGVIASGSGNTLAVSTSVTDIYGNASAGETITILPSIKISEIKISSSTNSKDEFIELYNVSPNAVDLSSLKLHLYNHGTTTDTNMTLTFFNTSIPSNGFFLIAPTSFFSENGATPDATYSTTTASLVSNGAAYISYSNTADTDVIDLVGWGTSTKKEGTAVADISAGTSIERLANLDSTASTMAAGGSDNFSGNGEESQNNLNDFVVQSTPVPQSSVFATEFSVGSDFNIDGDTVAPTVTDSFPSASTSSFVPANLVTAGVDFSETMDSSTVTTTTIKVTADSDPGTNLCSSVVYDPTTTFGASVICTMNSGALPLAAAAHTLTVTTGVADIAGNNLASEYTVAFTPTATMNFDSQVAPTMVGGYPSSGTDSFPLDGSFINLNFDQSLDSSTLAGSVTLTNTTTSSAETITGLSLVTTHDTDDSIELDVSGVTFVAGNSYSVGISTGLTSSTGIAITAALTIPFIVAASNDITGPIVNATDPANSATGVSVGMPIIHISVDDALNSSTVDTTAVLLLQGSDVLPVTVSYNSDYRAIEIYSSMAFEPNTVYTVKLAADTNANEIQNVSGVGLQDTDGTIDTWYTISFTTGAADSVAPTANYATATQNSIEVTFSEMMLATSIENLANWTLESPVSTGIPLSAMAGNSVSWDPGTMTAKLSGFSLTAGTAFQVTVGTGIRDIAGNALDSAVNLGGTVFDVGMYGGDMGPGAGFSGDTWDMPMGFSSGSFGYVPQASVFPMSAMAGAASNYMVDFPITEQIRASGNNGKVILTFPSGFDVTNAANVANSPANSDVNGSGTGTVAVNSVTANASARTVTVDFSIATRCATANTDPCVSGDEQDFISFNIGGIINSSVPRSWETSGYTVDIKTMTATTLLETMTSMPFFINAAGTNSLVVDLTAGSSATGTVVIHAWSPTTGEMTDTADFSTDGDGTASVTFTGLPADYFDVWTEATLTIVSTDDFQGLMHEPVNVSGSTTLARTLTATSGLQSVIVNVTGATGKDIDVVASGPQGFQVKRISSTSGSDSVTLKLADGDWNFDVMPHMPMDGGFIMPEPPDYIVAPSWLPVTVASPNVIEASGTANDGIIAFVLTTADYAIPVDVVDTSGNPIVDAMVFMDSTSEGFGTFGQTSTTGRATLNVNEGTYRIGAFMQGAPPTREMKIKIDSSGNIFQDGATASVAVVTIELSKGGNVISGTVTDGTNPVVGSGVHAFCTANCNGYFDAGTITDTNGTYTLYVGNGTWSVEAYIPGYGPTSATSVVVSSADQTGINLEPDTSATYRTISGTVCKKDGGGADCSGGTGLDGIEIFVWSNASGAGSNFTKTASDGTYSLRVPGATGYTVEAWDHRTGPLPIITGVDTSSANQTSQDIVIDTPVTLTINIKDAAGSAVTLNDMFIEFFDDTTNIRQHVYIENASSSTIDLPEGTYNVAVHTMAARLEATTAVQSDDAGTTVTNGVVTVDGTEIIKIVVPDLKTITGQLTDGSNPVADAWVEISDPTNGLFMGAVTDSSGNYSVSIPNGSYQVNAFSPGLILQPVTLVVDGTGTLNLIGTTTTLSITGTITDPSGNAVPYAFVTGQKAGGGGIIATQADADGEYTLPVNDGSWTINGNGYGYESKAITSEVVISGSSSTSNDIQFTATVSGLNAPDVTTITPSEGGMANDSTLGLSVTVPGNATSTSSSAGTITLKETNNVVATSTTNVVGNGFEISMIDAGGTQLTSGFTEEVTIERTVSVADLNTNGITTSTQTDNMTISYFSSNGTWVPETTTVTYLDASGDVVASPATDLSNVTDVRLKTAVDHFTVFSITVPSDGVSPGIPTGLTTNGTNIGITVNWSAVTTNSDGSTMTDLAGYEVYRDSSSSGTFTTQLNSADIITTSYNDATATTGVTYYYKVTTADTGGLESTKSSSVSGARLSSGSGGGGGSSLAPTTSEPDVLDTTTEETTTTAEDTTALDTEREITIDSEGHRVATSSGEIGLSPFTGLAENISNVYRGQFIRSYSFSTIYFIDDNDGRRPFWNAKSYFTWATSWNDVVWVTDATLTTLNLGAPMLPKPGSILVKIQSDPKVYAIEEGSDGTLIDSLRWITTEEIAIAIYGTAWADSVIDLEPTAFARYSLGSDIESEEAIDISNLNTRLNLASH